MRRAVAAVGVTGELLVHDFDPRRDLRRPHPDSVFEGVAHNVADDLAFYFRDVLEDRENGAHTKLPGGVGNLTALDFDLVQEARAENQLARPSKPAVCCFEGNGKYERHFPGSAQQLLWDRCS